MSDPGVREQQDPGSGEIRVSSASFDDGGDLPRWCSPEGQNVPPALEWSGVPEGAAELAVLCEDPDAPGGTFLHWLVSGIAPRVTGIGSGDLPEGTVESRNGFGKLGWGGPHPPAGHGTHRYFFRVFAADRPLRLDAESTADDLRRALAGTQLGQGEIVGRYRR